MKDKTPKTNPVNQVPDSLLVPLYHLIFLVTLQNMIESYKAKDIEYVDFPYYYHKN